MDLELLDMKEIQRRAQARIDWDGGGPLPKDVPPEVIVALVKEVERLKGWLHWIARDTSLDEKESARAALAGKWLVGAPGSAAPTGVGVEGPRHG